MLDRGFVIALMACAAILTSTLPQRAFAGGGGGACTYGSCAPSNTTINNQVTQYSSTQTAGIITDRISQATSDAGAGGGSNAFAAVPGYAPTGTMLALGNGGANAYAMPRNFGVWADVANLWLKDTQSGADYSGQIFTGIAGFDYLFYDRVLLGFAAGYERINLDTVFNAGKLTSNGYAASIYGGYMFSPAYSLDFLVGYASIDYRELHAGVTGSFHGNRWFTSTNFNARYALDNWRLRGSVGFFYVNERQAAYTESNANAVAASTPYVGQIRVKGVAGYHIPTTWGSLLPYGSARLEFDVAKSAAPVINSLGQTATQGNFGTTFALGMTAKSTTMSGASTATSIEATTTQFRQNFQSYGVKGTIRVAY